MTQWRIYLQETIRVGHFETIIYSVDYVTGLAGAYKREYLNTRGPTEGALWRWQSS